MMFEKSRTIHTWLSLLGLLLILAACAPAATSSFDRDGDQVRITIRADEALYDTTLHASPAETDDERCQAIENDIACSLGDIPAGQETYVMVTSPGDPPDMSCLVVAKVRPGPLAALRPYPCDPPDDG